MRRIIVLFLLLLTVFFSIKFFPSLPLNKISASYHQLFNLNTEKIRNIDIINVNNISKERILEQIKEEKISNDFLFSLQKIKKKLTEINEIESFKIQKNSKGNITIDVKEKKPFMLWVRENKTDLIDINGEVLNFINFSNANLPILKGIEANKYIKLFSYKLDKFPFIKNNFQSAELIEKYRWNINLNNNIDVKLSSRNIDNDLYMLNNFIKNNFLKKKKYKSVDFRVDEKIFFE